MNNNEIKIFSNEEFGEVRIITITEENWFCLVDICKILGLSNATVVSQRLDTDERTKFNLGRQGDTTFVNESGLYAVILRSDKEKARKFRKWITSEVLPSLRKTGTYTMPNQSKEITFKEQVECIDLIAKSLNVNDASKILMYENLYNDYNLPNSFLPKYENNGSKEMKNLTDLLKENNVEMRAVDFNKLLIKKGFLEERSRKSSNAKNGIKKYKALTQKGLEFGENLISPHNQKEVQPYYYVENFKKLVELVVLNMEVV